MVEMLVTVGITGVTLASAVSFLSQQGKHMRGHALRLEAQQAVRSSLDAITRDLRLAGACLPATGQYTALAGTNSTAGDTITIRTALVRTNMSCILSASNQVANNGATTIRVQSTNGFTADMIAYFRHPNGSGEFHDINGVTGTNINFIGGLTQQYPVGSGVYAVDERVYAIDKSNPQLPRLMLTINRAAPAAFAAGITDLQIKYILDQNCPPCDQVDLPANTAQWRLVNDVRLTATVKTIGGGAPMGAATFVVSTRGKPRNLWP
jgi:hypothetical protein